MAGAEALIGRRRRPGMHPAWAPARHHSQSPAIVIAFRSGSIRRVTLAIVVREVVVGPFSSSTRWIISVGDRYRRANPAPARAHSPHRPLALPLRLAVAMVFWDSAMTQLASWQTTLHQFETDCRLPFLPPHPAAYMALAIEVTTPVLLILGLLTRPASLVLLGMIAVIEIFIYPRAWPTHIQWAAMPRVLFARGPGKLSLDRMVRRRVLGDA